MNVKPWLALVLILALGASLRLFHVTDRYLDAHRWRQVDTAAIARNFHEGSLNPLYPRVDWGGAQGYVEAEFPLLPWIIALGYRLAGFHETLGRLVVIVFALGLILAVHRLALLCDDRPSVALGAAFLVAISPAAVFFGRTVMPDSPMLFFAVLALVGFIEYGRRGSGRWLAVGSVSLGLACLTKIPAVFVLPPIAAVVLRGRGWRAVTDIRLWLALGAPLLVTAAWYWHAHELFLKTGLTFGILAAPAKTYPDFISPGPWPSVFSKWSTWALLSDLNFYERMFARLYHFVVMPVGFAGAVVGAAIWRGSGRLAIDVWLGSMLAFVLVAGEGHRAHEYYQLPFVAIGAVYFGAAVWALFDPTWLARHVGPGPSRVEGPGVRLATVAAVVTAVGLASFYYSGVTQTHFRVGSMDTRLEQAGDAVDERTDDGALAVVVDDYGVTSPLLLYFARLKGWSFDPGDLSPALIDRLQQLGARYFVTTQWSRIREVRPEVAAFLERYEETTLDRPPGDTMLFDLRRVR